MINFYSNIKSHSLPNPNFKSHGIKVPFRMLIVGSSGAGKSNFALNVLHKMKNTFTSLIIVCKSKYEPLYEMLEQKLQDGVSFYEEGKVPDLKDLQFENGEQTLIIFDDMVCADKKTGDKISEFFIRSRKKNMSCMYIAQSYYKTPKLIRQNCSYIALRGISSTRDLTAILREYGLALDAKKLIELYKYATSAQFSFLVIDIDNNTFRQNFKVINI